MCFEMRNEKLVKFVFFLVCTTLEAQSRSNEIEVSFSFSFFAFLPSLTMNENELVKFVLVLVQPYGTAVVVESGEYLSYLLLFTLF